MKRSLLLAWLLILAMPMLVLAQQRQVSGQVLSDKGQPVAAASVMVKGSTTGTTADENGRFTLQVPETAVLVISAAGYQPQEIRIGTADNYTINLQAGEDLSAVVVTALGISRKERSLGYATQQVKGDNLTLTKEQNVIGSLAGKIAGVQVVGSSGASMGGTQKIKIRGVNSITGGGEPLIVVDGTPVSNANFAGRNGGDYGNLAQDINPEDIESVNVLKGPAASALYGIRGQYGVIMITTKKGGKGKKATVQLNSAFSIERVGDFIALQDVYGGGGSQTWRTLPNGQKFVEVNIDESWGPRMDGTLARSVFSFYPQDPEYGQLTPFVPHPNNIRDFFETGTTLNNGISVMGGGENSTFRISFNNTRIRGIEPATWLRRNNLGVSAALDITPKLNVATNFTYATNNAQRPSQGYNGGSRHLLQWFQRNIDMKRLKNYRYPDGTFLHWNLSRPSTTTGEITDWRPPYWNNPYFEAYENLNNDRRDRFFGDIGLNYKLLPGLKLSGFIRGDMYTQNIETREAFGGTAIPGYSVGKYQNKEMNYELLAQYTKNWGDLSLNANLGGNLYTREYSEVVQATVGGLTTPGYYNIAASKDRPSVSNYLLRKEIRSAYGMVGLGYKDIYFLDASLRNDISSTLPENNNSYWYPSVSGSVIFSELLNWSPLSYGKLRASYAQAGSDLSPYRTTPTFGVGGIYSTTTTLFVPDNLSNPDIEPSFAHSYEAGLDLQFFKNRLGMNLTYYVQKNRNQIINLDVSGTSGYSSTIINAGLIQSKGIELTLTGSPIRSKNFQWDITFNIAKNENLLKELYPGTNVYDLDVNTYSGVSVYLKSFVGKSFGSLIGKAYQRDSATGKILLHPTSNMPLYTEANHDFGTVLPEYTGGIMNTFRLFEQFDISAMVDYQIGGKFFSWTQMMAVKTGMAEITAAINDKGKNVRDPLADGGGVRVDGINATTKQPVTAYVDARSYYRTTLGTHVYEEWLYDASYIKLRELRAGYTFGAGLMKKLPFKSVNVAVIARNPWMIWQRAPRGLDPSELSTGSSAISWLETGTLNTARSYGINLNIIF
ncbi:MAG TPA: SusC/RagA family TonB-linked outer membrane protein [Chitinophagaceae bacterium]|nr:SusC/RagA family TonB-linked outer membrane protein [Chitinophagaceae bacterium]